MNKNNNQSKFPPLRRGGGLGRGPSFNPFFLSILFIITLFSPTFAEAEITFQYIYDDTGQLIKVIDSTGTVVEYFYDETGNRIGVTNSTVSGVAIFNFSPKKGPIGQTVTIQGQGFKSTIGDNIVQFNGTTATITAATANLLTVTVPAGATTGSISVAVIAGTATSANNFTLIDLPVITAIDPLYAVEGFPTPKLKVVGLNLNAASFDFSPKFVPPLVSIDSAVIDPGGASATLDFTVAADAGGSFVLVATNPEGRSDPIGNSHNTLLILNGDEDQDNDGLSNSDEVTRGTDPFNHDSDGDGFSDGDEVADGSDPLDKNSLPPSLFAGRFVGQSFTIKNLAGPSDQLGIFVGRGFSIQNLAPPSTQLGVFVGREFSLQNLAAPEAILGHTEGPLFSVENLGNP